VTRFQGLDRLYFEHVGGKEDHSAVPAFLAEFLPAEIQTANLSLQRADHEVMDGELEYDVEVRDFHLPLQQAASDLWLRQIVAGVGAARITQLWWALYDHGRRSDVWYFSAAPERTDPKMLSNYEIEAALADNDGLKLRIYGSMFRPQGAWWVTGKTFRFSVQGEALVLSRVLNDFGFFHGYDTGDTSPLSDLTTEHEVGGRFEILNYDKIRKPVLRACRFLDPLGDDDWEFNWARFETAAECIAMKMKARVSSRALDQPSFIERGGKVN